MAIKLPQPFVDKVKLLLGSEFEAFLASYDELRHYGLRVNPLKVNPKEDRLEKSSAVIASKGYCLIGVDGFPLGWGKWMDGMLKNEYPPGWRWT